jgi:hypothetical protein
MPPLMLVVAQMLPGRDQRCWSREGRETLLRAPAASATRADGVCYMRRRPLLLLGGVGCYHGRRRLLPYGRRHLLHAAACSATMAQRLCYESSDEVSGESSTRSVLLQ